MHRNRLKQFKTLAKKTRRDPKPKNVHELRSVTRKLRAYLWLVPKSDRTPAIAKALIKIKRLTRVLGEQRQYDVALADARNYGIESNGLKRKHARAREAVLRHLKPKKRKRYVEWLEPAFEDLAKYPRSKFGPRLATLKQRLDTAITRPPASDRGRHDLRIEAKRARYVLLSFDHKVPRLKQLQDHLGRWHDLTVIAPLARGMQEFDRDRNREWSLAQQLIRPALKQTSEELSAVVKKL